ncbi:MAG: dephospho-CoA kinase, partial [Flavobacteriaceae bacterium]|nr:dephospho-CoA kinase [Flavobacteriaceae bacterium]
KEKLFKINKIIHPEIDNHFNNWVKKQKSTYVIQENAIIFESDKQNNFDVIITVTAPKNEKIKRVIARDNSTKTKVLERMKNQLSDSFKIANSKYVIYNIDLEQSKLQVQQIHSKLV